MATAPIEFALPGLTGFTLTLTLYPHGSDTAAVSGLTLTEATNRKGVYTTTTTAALSGVHLAVALEGSTVRGMGYVLMDDTTNKHMVVSTPWIGNTTATLAAISLTQSAAQIASALDGTDITVYRGTKWSIAFTNLGALTGWTKLYFTVRLPDEAADARSLCQIKKTNPTAGTDGLLYFNGAAATAANGSITVDDEPTGDLTIAVAAAETEDAPPGIYRYDVKLLTSTNVSLLTIGGEFTVLADVTRAVS